jgi:hypothetical protein
MKQGTEPPAEYWYALGVTTAVSAVILILDWGNLL